MLRKKIARNSRRAFFFALEACGRPGIHANIFLALEACGAWKAWNTPCFFLALEACGAWKAGNTPQHFPRARGLRRLEGRGYAPETKTRLVLQSVWSARNRKKRLGKIVDLFWLLALCTILISLCTVLTSLCTVLTSLCTVLTSLCTVLTSLCTVLISLWTALTSLCTMAFPKPEKLQISKFPNFFQISEFLQISRFHGL